MMSPPVTRRIRRAIASFRRASLRSPSRIWVPVWSTSVRIPSLARTNRGRSGKCAAATVATAAAAMPPLSSASVPPTVTCASAGTHARGRRLIRVFLTRRRTRPLAETTQPSPPRRRSKSTACSGVTTTFSVCGKERSKATLLTYGTAASRRSRVAASTSSRLLPTIGRSAVLTCSSTIGVAPVTWTASTAKTEVRRAPSYAPTEIATSAIPSTIERGEGAKRRRSNRLLAGSCATRAVVLGRAATLPHSPPGRVPLQRRKPQPAEKLHLVLELDTESLAHPPPRLPHERERIRRCGVACVLDEVRVTRRDSRAADPVAFQAALLDHPSGSEVRRWVLEHAAEGPLRGRLCRLPLREQLGDVRLDLVRAPRRQGEANLRDDLSGLEVRVPVGEPQVARRQRAHSVRVDDDRIDRHAAP